jgi:hypothetical protein
MHPRIEELFAYLDQQHERLRTAYESIPPECRSARPAPDAWSPAEVVTHLVLVERRLATMLETLIAKARTSGVSIEASATAIMPSLDLSRAVDRSRKITAPIPVDPRTQNERADWDDYERAHSAVKAAAMTGDGLALGEISHPHPIFGPLTLYEWIGFVGAHAARHTDQITESTLA